MASLRVAEAKSKDVGRGIGRIDPKDMQALGVEVGDVVEISGKKSSVAKIMPAYMEDRGKKIIQIDGIIRENAGAGIDDKVKVEKVSYQPATVIDLAPIGAARAMRGDDSLYIAKLLEGLPVIKGDRVRATLIGTRSRDFTVLSTSPKNVVVVQSSTTIKIKGGEALEEKRLRVSYEDVGGLSREINKIREMIELPLRFPEIFERLGIEAPQGVLLYGPPGCGKTLIARTVANETDAYFLTLSGPEIMHKFYGESEAHLRSIFEDAAAHAPAIIFLDELDAIAPKREELGGEKQVEKRVVAQLLALMDGLKSRGHVIVIGATNIPDVLDPALRRPGRFDREISISIPDRNGRLEILNIHTRGMPLAEDVDLEKLADITHGFVGADLEALCREAAMITIRKIFPKIDFEMEELPYETLLELEITMDNFMHGLAEVEPSAIREVFTEIPDVGWDDVGALEEPKRILKEAVEWPLKYSDLFAYAKTKPPKGILLYGPPGTGKTLLAKAVAKESGVNFISVKGPEILSKWIGESEKGIREVFKKAKMASPCIVFFDELDSLTPVRGAGGGSQVTDRVISQFLTEMDGIEELKGVVVLGATNRLDIIDPALLRTGRFDFLLEFPVPNEKARLEIFKIHTRGKPLDKDIDFSTLAKVPTEGMVGSDIESICIKASMLAIREFLEKWKGLPAGKQDKKPAKKDFQKLTVGTKHFKEAVKMVKEKAK